MPQTTKKKARTSGKGGTARRRAAASAAPPRSAKVARQAQETVERRRPKNGERYAALIPSAEERGKYVYCVIRADEPLGFGPVGIGSDPSEVHTVNYRDIAAVVSDTPIELYEPTRQNVLAHERVNETVMH